MSVGQELWLGAVGRILFVLECCVTMLQVVHWKWRKPSFSALVSTENPVGEEDFGHSTM